MKSRIVEQTKAARDEAIPLCVPEIRGNEWKYVRECLDSGWVSSVGSYVNAFEEVVAAASGVPYAVATVNGTAALHIALLCAGVEPGDEVLVSALSFIAPANAIRYLGAYPIFIDAEEAYWQLDPTLVERFLEDGCRIEGDTVRNKLTGRRVRAILPVDILGHSADLDAIVRLARRFELKVIEDATESLGASYNGEPCGARADVACLSFNGNKLITTGGGGMLVTTDGEIARRARYLTTQAKDDPIEYVHGEIGFNYRLTNVQAAIGVAQMENMSSYVEAKRANAARYTALLSDIRGLKVMAEAPWAKSTFWLYTVLIDEKMFGCSSRALLRHLAERKIQARPLWQPLHRSPAHVGQQHVGGEVAERLYRDALSLPSSVGLATADLDFVASTIRKAASR